jgi:hypothetical protein
MIGVLRTLLAVTLAAIAFEIVFVPRDKYRALDPDEPIAADGSMAAGRTRTIYDTNPIYRAASQAPPPDSDDPADFEARLKDDRAWAERSRAFIKPLLGRLDWSRCDDRPRRLLISAVHDYYNTRGREKQSFALRGPRAKAAVEQEWSTPLDWEIDDFVRHAVQYGILHKDEVPANVYPEFAKTFADTEEIGAGCPPLKAVRRAQKF